MGITVNIQNDGSVVLHRFDKNQQIFIPRDSWLQLVDLKDVIDHRMGAKQVEKWPLGNQLYAVISVYNNCFLLHIRLWWHDQPTKQGVSLNMPEWFHLYSFLHLDKEAQSGITILTDMLSQTVRSHIKKQCDGCQQSWSSQTDHECLMNGSVTAELCIDKLFQQLDVFEFTLKLAQKCEAEKLLLHRPFDTFQLVKTIKENEIKTSVLCKF